MKTIFITFLTLITMVPAYAQGIFNQNGTQRKYLMEQIALLQTYLGYARQGNAIVKNGTVLIGGSKKGELKLHTDYFGSLSKVNSRPLAEKVKAILAMYRDMTSSRAATLDKAAKSGQFSTDDTRKLKSLYGNLAAEAAKDIDELEMVISNGRLEMTDDERIREVDRIHLLMQQKYSLQRALNSNVLALALGRKRNLKDAENLRVLYGQ